MLTSLVVCSDLSIRVAFSVFSDHETGSGAKLNRAKCKGLWLGLRNGRIASPVDIEWTSEMAKFLGGDVGPGNLEEANWRPCITAVENTPISWRQRSLSYGGRALVMNALVLSRGCDATSFNHVPR